MKNSLQPFIRVITPTAFQDLEKINESFYNLVLFEGHAVFTIDDNYYTCTGKCMIFLTPYQILEWKEITMKLLHYLRFHGDFYCIEYHKKEVACNGILFNNIYTEPYIMLSDQLFDEVSVLFQKIEALAYRTESYNQSVLKSYLQLILALSSREKQISQGISEVNSERIDHLSDFQHVLETHFIKEKSVSFYADYFNLSVDAFSKKMKNKFGKTPSVLIQERMILEAKKKLHLTHKSVKEIANELGFADEFYFSRFFKKHVHISPKKFRDNVGVSIVAK
ncbi:helix-turn-helix domain-containing protein [Empedobacter brevis]|uniref:helix-turn-helix domain-containing protein n=1 Tax=Empedobacter brevis TaxID=247 RepID=UPI003340FE6B